MIALIPARAGSKRLPGKNMRLLAGHPLIAYTIAAAQQSGVFDSLLVCTDDEAVIRYLDGRMVPIMTRAPVPDDQPDIVWVTQALAWFREMPDSFAILRPTAPFRTAATIRRARAQFSDRHDSLRAVQPAQEHPGKMWWTLPGDRLMSPVCPGRGLLAPWHSMPTQNLPAVYVQNASLEMAWLHAVRTWHSISGPMVAPFLTEGYEGLDINTQEDWDHAEHLIVSGQAVLPDVR